MQIGDGEKQAAEVLAIPHDQYSQGALIDFKADKRLTHWDTW